jgi:16S rRNA pseudouridine516 synthase
MLKRIDQILSNTGFCSRNEARKLLKKDRVTVNGTPVKDPSFRCESSLVKVDGELLDHPDGIFVMFNKPAGYVCSHDAGEGARIYDFFPEDWLLRKPIVASIGRLDKDTTGIILVTDHTDLMHDLTSPKRHIEKVYRVTVNKPLTQDIVTLFAEGTLLLDKEETPCLPAKLDICDEHTGILVLTEGRYHQVKRMFEAVGNMVTALTRERFGPYELGDLKEGEWVDVPLPADM